MKTNVLKFIVSGLLLSAVLTACGINLSPLSRVSGSGNVVTETRQVTGFDGVTVTGAGNILID